MNSRRLMLEEIQQVFKNETIEYEQLQEYFDRIDEDLKRNKEEEEIITAVKHREAYADYLIHKYVTLIQKLARGRRARVEVSKMKSKKGKKGGKGKKGKK
jgi:uncharacterized protein Yka (UPF0111/DUF47 family)